MSTLKADWPRFERKGVAVYGISVDRVPSLAAFASQQGLPFPLLSDWRAQAARAYGIYNEERGIATRSLFLIDPRGVVRWKNDAFNVRDPEQVAALQQAIEEF